MILVGQLQKTHIGREFENRLEQGHGPRDDDDVRKAAEQGDGNIRPLRDCGAETLLHIETQGERSAQQTQDERHDEHGSPAPIFFPSDGRQHAATEGDEAEIDVIRQNQSSQNGGENRHQYRR